MKIIHVEQSLDNTPPERNFPYDLEIEEAVLGSLILSSYERDKVMEILKPTDFYNESHKYIYRAIQDLKETFRPIDMKTVSLELQKNNVLETVGGTYYVATLTCKVHRSESLPYFALLLKQFSMRREAIILSQRILTDAFDEAVDIFDLLSYASSSFDKITSNLVVESFADSNNLCKRADEELELRMSNPSGITGVASRIRRLDEFTSGFQNRELIILAARPGMGKTGLAGAMMLNMISHGTPAAFFSLEMSDLEIQFRFLCSMANIDTMQMNTGRLNATELARVKMYSKKLREYKYYIDGTPGLSIIDFKSRAVKAVKEHGVKIIFIDYLQLMSADVKRNANREQEISQITRSLKNTANELNVPIVAISQLSRNVESRKGEKRPMLSDLRESGAIEQDADMVMFLYRPLYYGIKETEEGDSTEDLLEIIIAKNRKGKLGRFNINFLMRFMKVSDESTMVPSPTTNPNTTTNVNNSENTNKGIGTQLECPF